MNDVLLFVVVAAASISVAATIASGIVDQD